MDLYLYSTFYSFHSGRVPTFANLNWSNYAALSIKIHIGSYPLTDADDVPPEIYDHLVGLCHVIAKVVVHVLHLQSLLHLTVFFK